ncbi:MAG TPA: PAS domain-containing protein [Terriglobales bacterium]|nr:PAS domain-containing protein [Terriglobales bacterium]
MLIEHAYGFEPLTDRPQRLYDIWDRWRGDRAMPAREAVMPEDLRDLLAYVALMEAGTDPADCRYLITGTAVDAITVQSFKGRTIRDTIAKGNPTRAAEILALYGDVIANRRPSFSRGSMAYQDRGYVIYDRVLLPLSAEGLKVDHILCGFFYDSI